ncbi:MAG: host attachment family protein [Caulobacteraceae bacterium]
MKLPRGATVAVVDGEKLHLYRNSGDEADVRLTALPKAEVDADHMGSDPGHRASSANPDGHQAEEDGFAVGVADILNRQVLEGGVTRLMIIAAPRTLGELRKHYHKALSAALLGELHKDLTDHAIKDVEHAIASA